MIKIKEVNQILDVYDIAYENEVLLSVMIELTSRCNWHCKHCYVSERSSDVFNIRNLNNLFIEFRKRGVNELVFIGGEIFIRKDMLKIIELARSMFFNVVLETNVSLLNEEIINELANQFVSEVSCTVFTMDDRIHDDITKSKSYLPIVKHNLELLKKNNIKVSVKMPIMRDNMKSYNDVKDYCIQNGFKFNVKADLFPKRNGDKLEEILVSRNYIDDNILEFDRTNKHSFIEKKNLESYPCLNTRISLFIDYLGNVYPCINYRKSMGNVFTHDLEEIWNSSIRKQIAHLRYKDLLGCTSCDKLNYCVVCPGVAHMETGNIYECSTGSKILAESRYNNEKILETD